MNVRSDIYGEGSAGVGSVYVVRGRWHIDFRFAPGADEVGQVLANRDHTYHGDI